MSEIKLSLTVVLPGRTMVSKEESLENSKYLKGESIEVYNTATNKMEKVNYWVRKYKDATQNINISREAYMYMKDQNKPYGYSGTSHDWKHLKNNERIVWHCQNIAEQLGGELLSYHVYDD